MTKERVLGAVRVVGAGLILAAVIAQLSRQVDRHASVVNFFSFFTIQSNLFAAVILAITGVVSVRGQSIERYAMVRGAATTYMVTVGITYTLLLRGLDRLRHSAITAGETVQPRPRVARAGGWSPRIVATMSITWRVSRT